jgi:hypothetical protein
MITSRMPLDGSESVSLQSHIDVISESISELGLDLHVERDFESFVEVRRRCDEPWIYPSFDPRLSDLSSAARWLRASTPDGDTVGTFALRVFDTSDFYDLMRSGALWFGETQSNDQPRCRVQTSVSLSGLIGHCGGAWVHPAWRGRGLVQLLCLYSRALLLRDFDVDHETALVFERLYRNGLARRAYHYPRLLKVIDGFFPPTGTSEQVYLCHIAQDEMWAGVEQYAATARPPVTPELVLPPHLAVPLPQPDAGLAARIGG